MRPNYGVSLLDPDEEEQRRQELAAMESFANRVPMSQAMSQYDAPEPDVERAAAVLEAPAARSGPTPRELEDDAIRSVRDSYGKKRGFFEDAAPAAIAMGLDALLNKGRGTGAIVGGYGQGVMQRDAQDKNSMQQLAHLEITRAREGAEDAYRQQRHGVELGQLEARNAENQLARDRFNATKGDPESERAYKEALTNESQARANALWTKDPNAVDAETQARLTQQKQIHAEDLADRQAARGDAAATRAELAAARTAATKEKTDTAAGNKFLDATKEILPQAQALQAIEPTIEKYGKDTDMPGVGSFDSRVPSWVAHPFDSEKRQDADNIDRMARQAQAYFKHEITGAAGTDRETVLYEQLKGLNGTEEQFRNALTFWQNDLKSKIKGRASVAPEVSRNALDAQGLGRWTYGDEAPPPPPQLDDPSARQPIRLGPTGSPAPGQANFPIKFGGDPRKDPLTDVNPGGDTLQTVPGKPPSGYLEELKRRTRTPGVVYRP